MPEMEHDHQAVFRDIQRERAWHQLREIRRLEHADPQAGLQHAVNLMKEARRIDLPDLEAWSLYRAANCALNVQRLKVAEALLARATQGFGQLNDTYGHCACQNALAILRRAQGRLAEGYQLLSAVHQEAERHQFQDLLGVTLANLGLFSRDAEEHETALDWTNESLEFAEKMGDHYGVARTLANAVELCLSLNLVEQADSFAKRSHELALQLNIPDLISFTLYVQGAVCLQQQRLPEALTAFQGSAAIVSTPANVRDPIYTQLKICEVLTGLERYQEAQNILIGLLMQKTVEEYGELKCQVLLALGEISVRQQEYALAKDQLETAQEIAREQGLTRHSVKIHLALAQLHEQHYRFDEALRCYKVGMELEREQFVESYRLKTHVLMAAQEVRKFRDLNRELNEKNARLEYQANYDALTGCLNRNAFRAHTPERVEEPEVLCLFDIDHFKKVNDQFGHHAGDEVLREVARIVQAHLRPGELFCRWGGEEFAIRFPHASLDEVSLRCEEIRQEIAGHRFLGLPVDYQVTSSFGLAERGATFLDRTLQAADEALYWSKNNGRNRVRVMRVDGLVWVPRISA